MKISQKNNFDLGKHEKFFLQEILGQHLDRDLRG
jgi:hypothetical protein